MVEPSSFTQLNHSSDHQEYEIVGVDSMYYDLEGMKISRNRVLDTDSTNIDNITHLR